MPEFDHTDPLVFAVAVFDRWREQRLGASARVPAPLREIATRLLDIETVAVVARALQITEATLRRWQTRGVDGPRRLDAGNRRCPGGRAAHAADDPSSMTAFVPLPPPAEQVAAPASLATVVIERTDGVRLHLGGPIELATIAALAGIEALR